jgi:predicted 2-oxoglutarate/Fe(II)-dependent dioxygenase YbiX
MDAILEDIRPVVQRAVGRELLPTYSYFRVYNAGDALPPHTDRPECEVSVTLCLATSGPDWPLWVDSGSEEPEPFHSPPGSGVVYSGPTHTHWRDPFPGTEHIQLFVHYVYADGPSAHLAQDGRDDLGVSRRRTLSAQGLSDHIVVVDEAISPDLIRRILEEYQHSDEWQTGAVGSDGRVDNAVRDCSLVEMSHPETLKNSALRKELDAAIFRTVGALGRAYKQRFPRVQLKSDTGYNLLRYPPGGFYQEHVDHFEEAPRTLSMSLFLNDDFTGGGLSFFDGAFTVQPRVGRAVLFPANFLYPHQVIRVVGGTRYVVVTWFC